MGLVSRSSTGFYSVELSQKLVKEVYIHSSHCAVPVAFLSKMTDAEAVTERKKVV